MPRVTGMGLITRPNVVCHAVNDARARPAFYGAVCGVGGRLPVQARDIAHPS